jgi:probable addiction module antidote protein
MSDSPEMFLKACMNVIKAKQVTKVAREAEVTRESLYRSFSASGNPSLSTLSGVLGSIGLKINIIAEAAESAPSPAPVSAPTTEKISGSSGLAGSALQQFAQMHEFNVIGVKDWATTSFGEPIPCPIPHLFGNLQNMGNQIPLLGKNTQIAAVNGEISPYGKTCYGAIPTPAVEPPVETGIQFGKDFGEGWEHLTQFMVSHTSVNKISARRAS